MRRWLEVSSRCLSYGIHRVESTAGLHVANRANQQPPSLPALVVGPIDTWTRIRWALKSFSGTRAFHAADYFVDLFAFTTDLWLMANVLSLLISLFVHVEDSCKLWTSVSYSQLYSRTLCCPPWPWWSSFNAGAFFCPIYIMEHSFVPDKFPRIQQCLKLSVACTIHPTKLASNTDV